MARLFDHEAYLAELRELSDEDLCKRLEGEYHSAVGTYNAGPLAIEAAARIRRLSNEIRTALLPQALPATQADEQ